jgi:hypothetical protein
VDSRKKNANWQLTTLFDGRYSMESAQLAVLMDLRDELQTLNGILSCPNFMSVPHKLDAIRRNTIRRRRKQPRK